MKKIFLLLLILVMTPYVANAGREELSDGTFVDEDGEIYDSKFDNTDISAPWNDPIMQDDPLAPWNDPVYQDDPTAPWNDITAGQRDTNKYLRENGERDADYYWK